MKIKFSKNISNQKGFTVIEILAAFGVFMVIVMAQTTLWINAKRALNRVEMSGQKDVMKNQFAQDVSSQVTGYQINFSSDIEAEDDLKTGQLPLAWNQNQVYPKADCPECMGRAGFIIQPFELPGDAVTYRGMYRMVLRIQHQKLFPDGIRKEFLFIGK